MEKTRYLISRLIPAMTLSMCSGASLAALDKFDTFAYTNVTHDSNLFRFSGDEQAEQVLGDDKRDDTIYRLGGGFNSDLKLSRQHLKLDVDVYRQLYREFDDLDHTGGDGRLVWDWEVGNLWSGDLGYRYTRNLRSFTQQRIPEKDIRTRQQVYFDGGYQIHPDWELIGGLEYTDTSYDERKRLDRDSTSGLLEVQYKNTRNTTVGVRAKYTQNDLRDQDIAGISVSNDYDEYEFSGVLYWEVSGRSNLRARLGYTEQHYDDLDDRDFEGSTGRLDYNWSLSGKTSFELSAYRETSSLDDEIASYVLTTGVSLSPVWRVTPIVSLSGELFYENDDFKGNNEIRQQLGLEKRDDDTVGYGVTAAWAPRRFLTLSLGYLKRERDSSISANDYDDKEIEFEARLTF